MSDNIKTQDEYTNEWVKWIEKAVDREYFKFYEYNQFNNIQHIGTGGFEKVYRANWKNSEKLFALKSFFSLDNITVKEIVHNHNNYWLVMEYADGGSLRSYLNINFSNLTWDDKYNMAHQLSCAVSYLHNEGIVRPDLHSYKRSDIYSVGVLLWEIFNGKPLFYIEGNQYDIGLAVDISQGLRETTVPDTAEEYVKIYTKCWDGEPHNRPTVSQVVDWLNALITKTGVIITENNQASNKQELDEVSSSNNNSELQGELSQLIQNFNKMGTKEIDPMPVSSKQENPTTEKYFNIIVDEINDFNFKSYNKGIKENLVNQQVIEYLNDHNRIL
ncbi:kinase-like domain-containing protein [Rhizophagus clarus]|uniref:Kinase-like domain-containing protein n=1 Tax=Rhizophagus clarus TaxID=94130 RepID=A0A8H3MHY3_9GLOM|nr:kinase-like domain-containing protein [Rhizophagus clarus]